MDAGAFVIARVDATVHEAIVDETRRYFDETGQSKGAASLCYHLHARVPTAMVVSVAESDASDRFAWHDEHGAELARRFAKRLECEVWCITMHGSTGFVGALRVGSKGSTEYQRGEESLAPLEAAAKRLEAPVEVLQNLVDGFYRGVIEASLEGPIDGSLLRAAVATLRADPASAHPNRDRVTVFLPRPVMDELKASADRLGSDVGTMYWAAWEWAKPASYRALVDDAGRARKAPRAAPPKDLTPGEPDENADAAALRGERVEVELWLPSKVQKQIADMSEWCERGATWVFLEAYRCSRSMVLGARPGPPPKATKAKRARKQIAVAAMPRPAGQPADEDESLFRPPSSWSKIIDLRRGGWFAPTDSDRTRSEKHDPKRAFRSMADAWSPCPPGVRIQWDPDNGKGAKHPAVPFDPALAEVVQTARRRLERDFVEPDSPEVEAVTACLLRPAFERKQDSPVVSYWLGAAGYPFAVECLLASVRLAVNCASSALRLERYSAEEPPGAEPRLGGPGLPLARMLRRSLARASGADYERARMRCAELREASADLGVRVIAAYLFPTERAWVDEAAVDARVLSRHHVDFAYWPFASYSKTPYDDPDGGIGDEADPFLPAMVEGFGRELPRTIVRTIRHLEALRPPNRTTKLRRLGEALAAIPTDEAMTALGGYAGHEILGPYLNLAVQSYPKRAARLGISATG